MEERILGEVSHVVAKLDKRIGNNVSYFRVSQNKLTQELDLTFRSMYFVCTGSSFDPQTMFHNAASNIICIVLFGSRYDYDDGFLKLFIHVYTENAKIANGPWAMVRHFITSSFKCLY